MAIIKGMNSLAFACYYLLFPVIMCMKLAEADLGRVTFSPAQAFLLARIRRTPIADAVGVFQVNGRSQG